MRDIQMASVAAFFITLAVAAPMPAEAASSGTGKTLAATVLANSLGQDRDSTRADYRDDAPAQSAQQTGIYTMR